MKPVDMLVFHDPEKGTWGDCTRACVASIFELPAEEVPHFAELGEEEPDVTGVLPWVKRLRSWLNERGFDCLFVSIDQPHLHWPDDAMQFHYLCSGITERGTAHDTVYFGGKMAHNPQPIDRGELVGYPQAYTIIVKR